jgi:adenylyltransferase/sulfurtransferase
MSPDALSRYARHLVMPEVGRAGQARLMGARVLVVGAGGLGAPVLQYLVAAGVGQVTVMDPDHIERSNLQRQVLFRDDQVGRAKAKVAAEVLAAQNPQVEIIAQCRPFEAGDSVAGMHLVVDCTDNFAARYAINDACLDAEVPWIFASIHRFQGQCAYFDGVDGPCYRCLFPAPPPPELAPSCAQAGVLGVLPGFMGVLQASEALQRLIGLDTGLSGHLLTADLRSLDIRRFELTKATNCPSCVAGERAAVPLASCAAESQIRPETLADWVLIDVRSPAEHAAGNLGGVNHPLEKLAQWVHQLPEETPILLYCQTGYRSARGVALLRDHGVEGVSSLAGGYAEWGLGPTHSH